MEEEEVSEERSKVSMVLREIQVWVLEMELMKVPRDKVDAVDER